MILYKLVSTAACNPSGCAACRPLSISDPALYQLCLAAPGLCSGRDNQSYLFSPGHLGSCRCCALLCHTLVQCVVPHIVWTCGIIWALKISCYVPILLCKLKDSCYQSVPLWKAVSHLAGVFCTTQTFQVFQVLSGHRKQGCVCRGVLLWLFPFLFVSKQFIMPTLQQEHRQEIFLLTGTEGS